MIEEAGLYATLLSKSERISFHTPAHNNTLSADFLEMDTTELSYSDNLLNPTGVIKDTEARLAEAYGTGFAYIFTNGATGSIFAAIKTAAKYGDLLILGRNTHVSVYNAVRLFGIKARVCFSLPEEPPEGIGSVIVTSPDSYGVTLDLYSIRNYCDKHKLVLIVDSSHGAHFAFSKILPVSAAEIGDLVILSLHKTMPVVTGGALLCGKTRFLEEALLARKLTHTTSPNYMTMASIERAVRLFSSEGEETYLRIKKAILDFKLHLPCDMSLVDADDFSRAVIEGQWDAEAMETALEECGIDAEFSLGNKLVFIVTPYNFDKLPLLASVLAKLPRKSLREYQYESNEEGIIDLYYGDSFELLDVKDIVGRRAYLEIGLYPPGTPLIYGGQKFTEKHKTLIENNFHRCFGLVNSKVSVIL